MPRLIKRQWKKGFLIFTGLVLSHLTVAVILSLIARSTFLANLHNGHGLWNFAPDSFSYHREAIRLLDFFKKGDLSGWWGNSPFWHAKWIALSYGAIKPDPLSFAPVNAIVWTTCIYCVYKIARILFPERQTFSIACAVVFGFWPSNLLHTTQLLRDPLYVLGMLLMIWGWIGLLSGYRGLVFSLIAPIGVLLACLNRIYILEPLIVLSVLATALVLWRVPRSRIYALLAFVMIGGLYFYQHPSKFIQTRQKDKRASISANSAQTAESGSGDLTLFRSYVTHWLEYQVIRLANARNTWIKKYPKAGTNIDTDVHFRSLKDIFTYIPRAAMIGFLAPFPSQWFSTAKTAGRASRLVAGFEMMVWYMLLVGFFYFLVSGPVDLYIRIWMLVFTLSLVLLTALVVTNIGALYRMRFVYFLPILIGGLEGWTRFYDLRFQKAAV
jgi:hypothetical protein